uniref:C-type lectin domain-containing protein n=1 Tax=Takifugu rubripes TaxID=31033 RepID=A0A674NVJ3_TAKRU
MWRSFPTGFLLTNIWSHIWVSFICLAEKSCRIGWTLFNNFCYFFSCELKSWEASRVRFLASVQRILMVFCYLKQKFLSKNIKKETWIGLNDVETEGTWKWTDGNPLTKGYLSVPGWCGKHPDNGNNDPTWGEEDCAHLYIADTTWEANWNDISCNKSLQWVCEKKLG